MSKYTRLLDQSWYEYHAELEKYRVVKPIYWDIFYLGSGLTVHVPAGYDFDVSVPKWLCWLVNPHKVEFLKAACLHDFLLESGSDRVTAAAVFHEALKADGVSLWRRLAMWLAVSLWKWS